MAFSLLLLYTTFLVISSIFKHDSNNQVEYFVLAATLFPPGVFGWLFLRTSKPPKALALDILWRTSRWLINAMPGVALTLFTLGLTAEWAMQPEVRLVADGLLGLAVLLPMLVLATIARCMAWISVANSRTTDAGHFWTTSSFALAAGAGIGVSSILAIGDVVLGTNTMTTRWWVGVPGSIAVLCTPIAVLMMIWKTIHIATRRE